MSIKLTVVMSEYHTQLEYLKLSIESILNQNYSDFEFIIVLDGPNASAKRLINSYDDPRIRIVQNSRNRGLVYSLNRAIKLASGNYIVRMDTDDIAKFDRIKRQLDFVNNHPEFDVVGSRVMEFSESGPQGILGAVGEKSAKSLMRGEPLIHPSVIMRKSAVLKVGGYPSFKRAEDLALWCELLLSGARLYVMDEILLDYRVNIDDYSKRKLKYRGGELRARFYYYPQFGASAIDYLRISRFVISGILPNRVVQIYRLKFKLKSQEGGASE